MAENTLKIEEGIRLIQEAGLKLKVPNITIARAMILFHHFNYCVAENKYEDNIIAAIAIALSSVVDGRPLSNQDIAVVFLSMMNGETPDINSEEVKTGITTLVQGKEFFCRMLQFNLKHELAHQYLVHYLRSLREKEIFEQEWQKFSNTVFKVANSVYMSKRCLEYEASELAVMAIHIACKFCSINTFYLDDWQKALGIDINSSKFQRGISDMLLISGLKLSK